MSFKSYETRDDGDLLQTMLDWGEINNLPEIMIEPCMQEEGEFIYYTGFPRDKKTLMELDHLILYSNEILDIPSEIKCLTNLKELYFMDNYLEQVPDEIFELPNLKHLDLSENYGLKFTEKQLKKIDELLAKGCEILRIDID